MKPRQYVALALADAVLAGPNGADQFAFRLATALGRKHRWIAGLSRRIFERFGSALGQEMRARLVEFIEGDASFKGAWDRTNPPRIRRYFIEPPTMQPRRGALAACQLPSLATPGDLASWLGMPVAQMDWYADLKQLNERRGGALSHYRYRWIEKREGFRLIESPKPRLRDTQRRILREIVQPVAPHSAAHGFVRGRSCMTHAERHVGKVMVLRMDLRNFFGSVPAARITALFKTLGYPEATALVLAGLCTNSVPARILRSVPAVGQLYRLPNRERAQLERRHLPQGAPTSPALANLCALHLDLRLDALARSMACDYTRYADDITISGGEELRRHVDGISVLIATIATEEGFEVNHRKTRAMHQAHRQLVTGVVVNRGTNERRDRYDELKAILHNCVRDGPRSQNRSGHRDFRAHLAGRIAHVCSLNARRGAKLQSLFERIRWD